MSISQENIHITFAPYWSLLVVQEHPFIGMFDSTAPIFALTTVLFILPGSFRVLVGLCALKSDLLAVKTERGHFRLFEIGRRDQPSSIK